MSFPQAVKEKAMLACERHCCICREAKWTKIECHHIVPEADGGPNTFDNCIPLCFDCHAEVGGYNLRHPRGTRYTAGELQKLRDRWYEEIKNRRTLRALETQGSKQIELESFEKARRLAEDPSDSENQRRGVVKGWELLASGIMKMTSVSGENLNPLSPEVSRALKKLSDSTRVPDETNAVIQLLQGRAYSASTLSRYAGYDPDTNAALEYIAQCERVRDQLVTIYNSRGL
jgi:hypothetical protein